MNDWIFLATGGVALALGAPKALRRLELSKAKHRSLAGHPRMSRRLARLMPFYGYDEDKFFCADGAPSPVAMLRQQSWLRLAGVYKQRFAETRRQSAITESGISDMQFIGLYRVPFQFREKVKSDLSAGSFVRSTAGMTVTDLDGNVAWDLTGSFGVNVFGNDLYKLWIQKACEHVAGLGPVLGSYHPVVSDNVRRLKAISRMDEVSFHMSGTEAVMQAVRLARYHTGKKHLVRFCGSYHGWWGDVQPGVGNPSRAYETFNLKEMDEDTLRVLRKRKDIACVLVNPLQAMHPNRNAPGDGSLIDSSRSAGFDREAYTRWLKELRAVCYEKGIALIFDEVFMGFRLAAGGAQEYFGVRADLVTYGKTVGGGLPIGVVCGMHDWMKRYRDDAPADICFARGTFNSHPYVMAAMDEFLRYIEEPRIQTLYRNQETIWSDRAGMLNRRLEEAGLPVRVSNMTSVWTVSYTIPSRYNWMLQFYLRLEGLALSWVGTGRLIFCINTSDEDFQGIADSFVRAAQAMKSEGWWWHEAELTNRSIRRNVLRESWQHLVSGQA